MMMVKHLLETSRHEATPMNRKDALYQPRGFTLTELMISVVIIGLLGAFIAPSVSRYMYRNKGVSAANDVAGALKLARNLAMSSGQVVFVDLAVGGAVEVFQKLPNNCTGTNPPAACFSQSCAEANALPATNKRSIATPQADLTERHPDMRVSGFNIAGDAHAATGALNLCFAPDGRVLTPTGLPFSATCDGINARIFVQPSDLDAFSGPISGGDMRTCWETADTNAAINFRQKQKNDRDVSNFFVIQVPYNGAISVVQ